MNISKSFLIFLEQAEILFPPQGQVKRADSTAEAQPLQEAESANSTAAEETAGTAADKPAGAAAAAEETAGAAAAPQEGGKPTFMCNVCYKVHKRRSELKQHLFSHFRTQIQVTQLN